MIKTVKKSNSRYIMFSLSSGISVISLFLLSQILISMDPLKKSILRKCQKKYFHFLVSIYLCIRTPAFPINHDRKVLRRHTSAGKTLNRWFTIYRNMCSCCTSQLATCIGIA